MKFSHIMAAALVVVIATSCCPCRKQKNQVAKEFKGTQWSMIQFEGRSFQSNDNYTLTFGDDGRVSGKGDCNSIGGVYEATADLKLKMDKMISTRMFCPNQEQENKFLKMVQSVDSFGIDGDMLLLFSNGEQVAVFQAKK